MDPRGYGAGHGLQLMIAIVSGRRARDSAIQCSSIWDHNGLQNHLARFNSVEECQHQEKKMYHVNLVLAVIQSS